MIKHTAMAIFISTVLSLHAYADDKACAIVVCLSTDNIKAGGLPCQTAKKDFFKIVSKRHGVIDVGKTIKKRTTRVEACEGARPADTARVIARYGHIINPL